ncbi:hypothetical protein DEH81_17335 [Pectobacterium zantedeschiae]|uniref:Uncharacterized protein n=1 Tax=Pectobacterium zantedeschiae TaxID=2034769 RepID=A0A9X8JL20_9GAMM|nr:hypothetical protein DEH81_17335 [Pectobacterium zantedeschiae]RYC44419.1 hypothetical protein CLR69_05150 [Pectobacterium zantedeschiae]RYC49577.1 hypothetical protein CTN06_00950 [Pectobacterium zantedeschiae]
MLLLYSPLKKGVVALYQQCYFENQCGYFKNQHRYFKNCIKRKGTAIRFQRKGQIMMQMGYILGAYLPIFNLAGSG